jgi:multiple sugar transport system permease protein
MTVAFTVTFGGLLGYVGFSPVYLLPWFTAPIALAVVWKWILNPTGGLLSTLVGFRVDLLTNTFWAPITVAGVIAWCGTGYAALIFSSGLGTVQQNTVDAAALDGASKWDIFWKVQLPQIRQLVFFIVATTTVQAFASFDFIFVLTGGGPDGATDVASMHIVNAAMKTFEVGSASAMSIVFVVFESVILICEYLIYRRITRRFDA